MDSSTMGKSPDTARKRPLTLIRPHILPSGFVHDAEDSPERQQAAITHHQSNITTTTTTTSTTTTTTTATTTPTLFSIDSDKDDNSNNNNNNSNHNINHNNNGLIKKDNKTNVKSSIRTHEERSISMANSVNQGSTAFHVENINSSVTPTTSRANIFSNSNSTSRHDSIHARSSSTYVFYIIYFNYFY